MSATVHPPGDSFGLGRFLEAQEQNYATALREIRSGRKRSHWMWYVFPQLAGLGSSQLSERYAIRSLAEAAAYLQHPVLGMRLIECCEAVVSSGQSVSRIFGTPDDLKLRSCVTLFSLVSPPGSIFQRLLDTCFRGGPDERTLALLADSYSGDLDAAP